ncbi:MAG: BON domain-containing protein [Vicinamibacterales bacterium]
MVLQIAVLVAALTLPAATAAAQAVPRTPFQQTTDSAVAASVRDAPQLTVFDDVHATVADGVVTLTGKVTRVAKREALRRTVEQLEGVRGVQDLIAVLPPSKSDDELRERIARSIYGHASFWRYAMMSRPPVRIIVESGHVLLTGDVQSDADRSLARALAMQSGARQVSDDLRVRRANAGQSADP